VRSSTIVAGVLAQFQELFDVEVPGFKVGAHCAFALASLIDCHGGIVYDLQKGNHALRLSVGALDMRAKRSHRSPVVANAARELLQHRVLP